MLAFQPEAISPASNASTKRSAVGIRGVAWPVDVKTTDDLRIKTRLGSVVHWYPAACVLGLSGAGNGPVDLIKGQDPLPPRTLEMKCNRKAVATDFADGGRKPLVPTATSMNSASPGNVDEEVEKLDELVWAAAASGAANTSTAPARRSTIFAVRSGFQDRCAARRRTGTGHRLPDDR